MDRRRDPRFTLEAPVELVWTVDGQQHVGKGKTRDVSRHGFFVLTDFVLPVRAEVWLNVTFPSSTVGGSSLALSTSATVTRVESIDDSAPQAGFAAVTEKYVIERLRPSIVV
jgi:hypothetical protein